MGNKEEKRVQRHKRHKMQRSNEVQRKRPTPPSTKASRPTKPLANTVTATTTKRTKPPKEEINVDSGDDDDEDDDTEMHDADEIDVGGADDELNSSTNTEKPNDSPTKSQTKSPTTRKTVSRKAVTISTKTTPPASTMKSSLSSTTSVPVSVSADGSLAPQTPSTANKKKRRRESGTSSDEERWLTAIESGKLQDVDDELKKMKDPKLMTARQRAMYERNMDKEPSPGGELLMSLPTGYREKEKPQTAEDIEKAALKSQKRKQMADAKREKDKKKTMDRLLKKQDNKVRSAAARKAAAKTVQPMIVYCNTTDGAYIHMPPGHEFPLKAQTAREPPKQQMCGIAGCDRPKVYNCSKTQIPLCSLECYRKNVQSIKQIIC